MTRICVFVASHIYYIGQNDLLFNCITHLINQTVLPQVYVSISFENDTFRKEFTNSILRRFTTPITIFEYSNKKLFQMEHIHKLTNKYANKYDLIMFCDDDDTYDKMRIETFLEGFEKCSHLKFKIMGVKEVIMAINPELTMPEYWAYGLIPEILFEFFTRFEKYNQLNLLQHKFGDLFLRHYLRKTHRNSSYGYITIDVFDKKDILYNYNTNNPNSICATLNNQTVDEDCTCKLIYSVLDCNSDHDVEELSKFFKNKITKKAVKTIYEFCKILYL